MQKLGMKPVPGISRVTIKKSKNVGGLGSIPATGWYHRAPRGCIPVSQELFPSHVGLPNLYIAGPLQNMFVDRVLLLTIKSRIQSSAVSCQGVQERGWAKGLERQSSSGLLSSSRSMAYDTLLAATSTSPTGLPTCSQNTVLPVCPQSLCATKLQQACSIGHEICACPHSLHPSLTPFPAEDLHASSAPTGLQQRHRQAARSCTCPQTISATTCSLMFCRSCLSSRPPMCSSPPPATPTSFLGRWASAWRPLGGTPVLCLASDPCGVAAHHVVRVNT